LEKLFLYGIVKATSDGAAMTQRRPMLKTVSAAEEGEAPLVVNFIQPLSGYEPGVKVR
jgi:hypothetical protein